MSDEIYSRLAKVLDTLPNGFPSTPSGVEIKLLRKVFDPDQAELFCDLRLTFETAEQIAERTGRPPEGLEEKLTKMKEKGQLFGVAFGDVIVYRMMPWVFGIYEFQLPRLDREFCELCEEYAPHFGRQFFSHKPQLMHIVPVEEDIPTRQEALPYERVSHILEQGQSFAVNDCVCRKEKHVLGKGCSRMLQACLAIAPIPGIFDDGSHGRVVSREEARALLRQTEENALVHMTHNTQTGNYYICNCCSCCCGVLRSINEWNLPAWTVVNSSFYARIDPETCSACGTCAEDRCQVRAIVEDDTVYRVVGERCIGCGLCVSSCPTGAIALVRKEAERCDTPPSDEKAWYEERGRLRGTDFSRYE